MFRVITFFVLLLCLAHSIAQSPTDVKSLSPTMTMRQRVRGSAFSNFRAFNRRRRRRRRLRRQCRAIRFNQFRTLSGFCNNIRFPKRGAADTTFLLRARPLRPIRESRRAPGARFISNVVCEEATPRINDRGMSELVTFFGQFLDHDVTLTTTNDERPFRIRVPRDDPMFSESQYIPFFRTFRRRRSPVNELTSYLDASGVYGVGEKQARELRELKGGRLNLPDNLLPRGRDQQFEAGDDRNNENPNLTAIHLLFAREHNRVAAEVAKAFPAYDDEQIYELARHIVAAELQAITYYEFIPALTGRLLPRYRGYRPNVRAIVTNSFATVAFRVGHTMLNSTVNSISTDYVLRKLQLRNAFFNPDAFVENTIEGLFRGMMSGHAAEIDNGITGEVRNFLIESATSTEQLDLAALNIQRGRDHGIPTCNNLRRSFRLRPFRTFQQITSDETVQRKLRVAYKGDIDAVDAWVCGISEDHVPGSSLGALFQRIVRDQFRRLRDGDRFYFERRGYFTRQQLRKIPTIRKLVGRSNQRGSILGMLIMQNTMLSGDLISSNPLFV